MKELSRTEFVDGGRSVPKLFMTAKQLSEYEGMTVGHYYHIFGEMAEEIKTGRYPDVVLGGSPVSVNYYAYRDYITNRKALRDRNMRKRVKPFDPAEVARLCPIVREVIVMGDEDD